MKKINIFVFNSFFLQGTKEKATKKYEKSNKLCPEKKTIDKLPLEVLFCSEDQNLIDNV